MRATALVAVLLTAGSAQAAPLQTGTGKPELTLVQAALEKGYGSLCSLSMEPVARGGYYRCLDVGPYRFVATYGGIRGFVVPKGQAPFEILASDEQGDRFLVQGPWLEDLNSRLAAWWSDEVEGARSRRTADETGSKRQRDAEEAVRSYMAPPEPPQGAPGVPAQAPSSAPVPGTVAAGTPSVPAQFPNAQQPAYGASAAQLPPPAASGPIPSGLANLPPNGVLVAPGVVQYPASTPQNPGAPRRNAP